MYVVHQKLSKASLSNILGSLRFRHARRENRDPGGRKPNSPDAGRRRASNSAACAERRQRAKVPR